MELSYAAYNYPNGEELPIIPGAFMGDFTKTAGMLLEDNGFVNISEYNYTSDSRAAHTIGCRFVEFPGTRNLQSNNIGGNYNVHQHNGTNIQLPVRDLLDSVCIRDYDQGRADFRDNTLITGEDTEISTSHDDEIETKPLVVVDIRGSVTVSDWINDVMTQFDSENNRFAAFADEIFTNVENFYSVSENGSFGRNSSSDYNHKLATWAMELSYAAYNYPNGEELPIIPGAFMGDFTKTAGMLLEDNGFVNISEYNYTSDSRAAHTIGWRPINVDVSETSQIINDAGGMDNVYQYNIDDKGSVLYNLLDSVRVHKCNSSWVDRGTDTRLDRSTFEADKINEGTIVSSSVQRTLLEDNGFVNISEYNYTSDSRAAHTIGWRPINVDVSETSQIINDAGGMDNVYQYNIDDKGSVLYNLLDQLRVDRSAHLFDERRDTGADRYDSITNSQSFAAGNKILKPLLVVDIRGSVTWWDWVNDIGAQALPFNNRFAALAEEVFTNVENYLSSVGLQDPIILITGHSMGAAIANILAARLNETMDSGNIYAYTFATQLDRVSNCFNNIDSYGNVTAVTASDYNHRLATWAMELSYAAYNYPNGEELPIIPGAFMGDFVKSANTLLSENGFVNITDLNYGSNESGAHTIGWRPIGGVDTGLLQISDDIGGNDNVGWDNTSDEELYVWNFLDRLRTLDGNSGRADSGNVAVLAGKDNVVDVIQSSAIRTMPLVVVDVRGSVTLSDWINDVMTQFDSENNRFAAFADEIFTNVENFYSVSENGSFGRNSSSDYNHKLATWAMELSYAAYNYPNGEELPIIPGAFMGDFTKTAGMLLEDNGFVNVVNYKYETSDSGAHTIGCRFVEFPENENMQLNDGLGGNIDVSQHYGTNIQLPVRDLLDSVCILERNSHGSDRVADTRMDRDTFRSDKISTDTTSLLNTKRLDGLVVVDIRGSVTAMDWYNDIMTQLSAKSNRFAALAEEMLTNVNNYIRLMGLQDPIILVTGHSMGAAIANILAARLNGIMDPDNVYAYTFATPRTVNEAVSGNQAVNYPNIFNILNSNDAVTYVPSSFFSIEEHWRRHGIDLYINMPYSESNDTDLSGMLCHAMPVYLNWLNSSEDLSLQEMLTLSEEARVRGLLPIIVKIKCPVGVTIKDSNGNIIGYESQQENAVYPDMLNRGVVSWIEEDGAKMFFIPSIADAASIEIEAYDYGSMNFTVGSVDASTESEIKTLNNISLYPGKEFIADISEDVPVEDTQLFITENGETVGEVTETNPHLKGTRVWHEVCLNGEKEFVATYWSFTTDKTVTEIHARNKYGGYAYLKPDDSWVKIVEDGDSLIWTVAMCYKDAVDHVYNVSVNSNGEWHTYENALHVHVPQEYADINREYFSSNATSTNTATIPAAVPYYTVIDPTDN